MAPLSRLTQVSYSCITIDGDASEAPHQAHLTGLTALNCTQALQALQALRALNPCSRSWSCFASKRRAKQSLCRLLRCRCRCPVLPLSRIKVRVPQGDQALILSLPLSHIVTATPKEEEEKRRREKKRIEKKKLCYTYGAFMFHGLLVYRPRRRLWSRWSKNWRQHPKQHQLCP